MIGYGIHRLPVRGAVPDTFNARMARVVRHANRLGVRSCVDVGANAGQYASTLRQHGFAGRMVSYEPVAAPFARLEAEVARDQMWACRNLAISDSDGTAVINVAGNTESSSLLRMRSLHSDVYPDSAYVGEQSVAVRRLDTALAEEQLPTPHLLKIDVQGLELHVLRGAPLTLAATSLLDVELSLGELYEGQAQYREVLSFLSSAGLEPISFDNGFADAAADIALQINVLFARVSRTEFSP
jgi:FkbM family methyltransferase